MATAHREVIIMFLAYFIQGLCGEANEETKVGMEYMQIFRNIPTLFEYFLDVLEQRVEVLEKNDISIFKENVECENNKAKREAESLCVANSNIPLIDKTIIVNNNERDAKSYHGGKYKRKKSYEALDSEYTTKTYEYGRASKPNTNLSKEASFNTKSRRREIIKTEFIDKPFNKRFAEINNPEANNFNIKKRDKNVNRERVNRKVAFGEGFLGTDWSQFYLAPEEVEEKALKTEQMIEDHNKKNRKK